VVQRWLRKRGPLVALLALLLALGIGYAVDAGRSSGPAGTSATTASTQSSSHSAPAAGAVALSTLPVQVAQVVHLIEAGGPFPYSQDGVVFDNNEHLLPAHSRGYYHEYTVSTPGEQDRGARRIVTGSSGEYYYTDDHYESFRRIDIGA
jgi:ribonuclease T1